MKKRLLIYYMIALLLIIMAQTYVNHTKTSSKKISNLSMDKNIQISDTGTEDLLMAPIIDYWNPDFSRIEENSGANGINVNWDEVEGAKEYEYKMFFVVNEDKLLVASGKTMATNASCYFQDFGDSIVIEVRAIGETHGKTIYSEWSTYEIDAADIEKLIMDTSL